LNTGLNDWGKARAVSAAPVEMMIHGDAESRLVKYGTLKGQPRPTGGALGFREFRAKPTVS